MTTRNQADRQRRQLYGKAIGPLREGEWEITESGGSVSVTLNPERNRLPSDARVVAIVDFNLRRQIFDCGTVGAVQAPRSRDGGDSRLALGSRMFEGGRYKLRIIDPNKPNFCIAWGSRSNVEVVVSIGRGNGQGIAVRKVFDLGTAASRLELDPGEKFPTIEINGTQNEPLFRALKQGRNPALAALLFPTVVDAILRQLAADHLAGMTASNQSTGGWKAGWLDWTRDVLGLEVPVITANNSGSENDPMADLKALDDWRKQVMSQVCGRIGDQGQAAAIGSWPETPGDAG